LQAEFLWLSLSCQPELLLF